ncbi:pyridoxal-phosphate dependent enzyme [Streptomyces sp. NBC_00341]|uniref:PLP-dependent cysteine synthase family protein n=1 Tax=Streptomyces sp. NBC_00341 TaxID=2975717 RepID=UPI0030904DA8|nr:pyridoxal-phosphate dependent enzyme [Streptomyces sp. NBC_00341]
MTTTTYTEVEHDVDEDVSDVYPEDRAWVNECVQRIRGEFAPLGTSLREIPLPPKLAGLRLYLKRESEQPSGSHKHRLAAALLTHALASGRLTPGRPVIEASSGSTAISEAWYCERLGIDFHAVVPSGTAPEKLALITQYGGQVHPVDGDIVEEAKKLTTALDGHFMDQFTYAERAYDWRGEEGLAPELIRAVPDLAWFVMGAGTGGTATSVARYGRYTGRTLRVCVTDPDHSAFFRGWRDKNPAATDKGSHIEGIGRPRVEPSFLPPLVNRMIQVHDGASVAAMRFAAAANWDIVAGPSTGTGLFGAMRVLLGMHAAGQTGAVATVMCDSGDRYVNEYYNDAWLADKQIDHKPWMPTVERFFTTGDWTPPAAYEPTPKPATTMWNM